MNDLCLVASLSEGIPTLFSLPLCTLFQSSLNLFEKSRLIPNKLIHSQVSSDWLDLFVKFTTRFTSLRPRKQRMKYTSLPVAALPYVVSRTESARNGRTVKGKSYYLVS